MNDLVFICYPETYVLLKERIERDRFTDDARSRITGICAAWEAAIETHGDRVNMVLVYIKDGILSFDARERQAWDGTILNDE